jgi:hypothetical protein
MRKPLAAWFLLALLGCSGRGDPPPYASGRANTGGSGGFQVLPDSTNCGLPTDAGLCGNEIMPTQQDRPNLYFIIDDSGSMDDYFPGSTQKKYPAAVNAVVNVLELIGHRVSYGAALFPYFVNVNACINSNESCAAGQEVFETRPGDSVVCARNGKVGDVLSSFQTSLKHTPCGSTPLSATLTKLKSTLTALPGKTAVILATDGAPNCNSNATCSADLCELNLDQVSFPNGPVCVAPVNCCDPKVVANGPSSCVDDLATIEILSELQAAAIPTYIVGLPGVGALSDVLNRMADAGGTARTGSLRYYEVSDSQSLADTLRQIAINLSVSCTISLSQSPPNWAQVKVYFDSIEVPTDTVNGWKQIDDHTLQITGTSCDQLMNGNVFQVQVTADCPTIVN